MKIDQGDLFWGTGMIFIQEFMNITTKESHGKGDFIFHEGNSAHSFYTLIEGHVRLSIGETGKEVYVITRAGEAFGWSSLLDRNYYSASAECIEQTVVLKVERNDLNELWTTHPECGFIFYKNLAGMLGSRLVQCYKLVYSDYCIEPY
jgi:CRP-like cAMP-binding protein